VKVVDVLTGEAFLQGLFLLIATAALTGLLVPVLKARLDERRYRDQKVFESELARQAKIIDAQAALLDDLSELLWGFLLRALALTYYAERRDAAKLEEAWTEYDAEAWPFYARLQVETSKAQRLTTAGIKDELERLRDWFMSFDTELTWAYETGALASSERRKRIDEGVARIEGALTGVAHELRLAPSAVSEVRG
jgi:uncharacterized membrane-anchored protein YhcB (DUF1043 family)